MPILIEFLTAPWKLFAELFGGPTAPVATAPLAAASPLPGSNAVQTASSGLCQTLSSGTEAFTRCRVFGYEMPPLILGASVFIFVLFAVSAVWLFRQVQALNLALDSIHRIAGQSSETFETPEHLEKLSQAFRSAPSTALAWSKLQGNLISDRKAGLSLNRPVEEFLNPSTLLEPNLSHSYFALVPGTLTGLGLLMTFVAILDGLSHVTVTESLDVQGISGLINGLSGKFFSSIIAVLCAVAFALIERALLSRPEGLIRQLQAKLSPRFRIRTTEQLLSELLSRGA